ncbi:MAG: TlyA family RNA methyltransferase, partial [Bdellovibrionales bacterium]|nr:TlyA family RNA methyltransferase [Bdellovibrionales bacterium]
MAKRLDLWLVENKKVPSRTKAQELIRSGKVELFINQLWVPITQPSWDVSSLDSLQLRMDSPQLLKYVSRGGLKLQLAFDYLHTYYLNTFASFCSPAELEFKDKRILDIGQSTGGFTDCLLQRGCREIVGVDVGHDQLHPSLRNDLRVRAFEAVNIKNLSQNRALQSEVQMGFHLIVVDLSFISLTQVLPLLPSMLKPKGRILALVKPQFEVGADKLNKRGIVKDRAQLGKIREKIEN